MKKIIKILLSVFVPVVCVLSLTLGLVFGLNKPNTIVPQEESQEEEVTPYKGKLVGGIYYASANEETGASEAPKTSKGAIYVADGAEVTINSGLISGHEALYGGAVYVESGGTLYVNGGTFTGNTSRLGGAIYVENGGTVEFTGGTITGNYAEPITGSIGGDGTAAVYAEYGATVTTPENCTISNNISQYYGNYVVYNVDGTDTYVSTGYEVSESFDLNTAPLDYEHCCGYFSDATFMTGVEEGADYANVQQYTTNTGKTFTRVLSGLYTKKVTNTMLETMIFDDYQSAGSDNLVCVRKNTLSYPTGALVIPRQYDGKEVVALIGGADFAFNDCTLLTSVTLPNSVDYIEENAFAGCSGLTSVTIPNSVTTIGIGAFYNCSGLTELTIGSGVTSIGGSAFSDCTGLTQINYNAVNATTTGDFFFFRAGAYSGAITLNIGDNVIAIPADLFHDANDAPRITSINFGSALQSIGEGAFHGCWCLTGTLTIPNTVTSIGANAFLYCSGLTELIIDSGVTSIGDSSFDGCSGLTSITIPSSVTSIGNSAFYGCTALTEINYNANISTAFTSSSGIFAYAGQHGNGITLNIGDNVTAIPEFLFYADHDESPKITSINFGSALQSIGDYAFRYCTNLTSLTLPNSLTTLGDGVFELCERLTSVTIGNSVTSIGADAFALCTGLTSITIPSSVTSIGVDAFTDCSALTEINYNANISTTFTSSSNVFDRAGQSGNGITLNIGNSVTTIPAYLFYGSSAANAPKLTSVTFGTGVTSIGSSAFSGCTYLTQINYNANISTAFTSSSNIFYQAGQSGTGITLTIGDNVTTIPAYLFYGSSGANAPKLTSVTFGTGLLSIGTYAFRFCTGLTSLTLPSSLNTLDEGAFAYCTNLSTATINVPRIGKWAFYGCNHLTSVIIGSGVTTIGNAAFYGCSGLTEVEIPSSVTNIENDAFLNCSGLTSISLTNNLTSIGGGVFYNCSSLASVTIPDSVTSIGNSAFYNCSSLASVTIPDSVTSIGSGVFNGCSGLTQIIVDEDNTAYASQDGILYNKAKTEVVAVPQRITGSVTLPDTLTSIGNNAFYNCTGLTSITIGSGVASIGSSAFFGCTALTEINYNANISTTFTSSSDVFYRAGQSGNGITLSIGNNVTTIPAYLFYGSNAANAPKLTSVTFGTGLLSIGAYAFRYNTRLTSLDFQNSSHLTSLGEGTFAYCTNVSSVTLNISEVPKWAFYGCSGITNLNISGVETIGIGAFYGCYRITTLTMDGSVTSIGDNAFYNCTGLTSIAIPDSNNVTTSIGNSAFYGCTGLTSVSIGNGVTSIGSSAFYGCTAVTSITIGSGVASIGSSAFYGCTALTQINYNAANVTSSNQNVFFHAGRSGNGITLIIGNTATTIPAYLFYGSTEPGGTDAPKITSINFASASVLQSIGDHAFRYCTNLTSLTFPNSLTTLGEGAFEYCTGLNTIGIQGSVSTIGTQCFYGCHALDIYYSGDVAGWCNITFGNRWHWYDNAGWTLYINNVAVNNLTVSGALTGISDYAFYNNAGLNSVSVSSGDTSISIGMGAFYNCNNVTMVTISGNVTIGESAFDQLGSNTVVVLGRGIQNLGLYAFRAANSTSSVVDLYYDGDVSDWCHINFASYWILANWTLYINNTAVTNLAIPSGVTSIPDHAFYFNEGITNVTMSDSVTSVGTRAFMRCSNLEKVTIGAGVQTIGDRAFNDCVSLAKIYIPSTVVTIINAAGTAAKGILAESSISTQIYTDLASQANIPAGWDQYFNYYDANTQLTVNYNVTKQQFDQM